MKAPARVQVRLLGEDQRVVSQFWDQLTVNDHQPPEKVKKQLQRRIEVLLEVPVEAVPQHQELQHQVVRQALPQFEPTIDLPVGEAATKLQEAKVERVELVSRHDVHYVARPVLKRERATEGDQRELLVPVDKHGHLLAREVIVAL